MDDRLGHQLSQFLDGRLPAGQREQLLERIAEDAEAARLLEEMECAQDLARSLPVHRVGRSFSETLWDRIRSGEGTPEAVFREHLPVWTRLRYVASGAVAAAMLIAAVQVLVPNGKQPAAEPRPEAVEVATMTPPAVADDGGARHRLRPVRSGYAPVFAPILPETVAQAGQVECVQAVASLQRRAPRLEERLVEVPPRQLVGELVPEIGRVRGSARIIRWMQSENLLSLPAEFETTLTETENILRGFERANTTNDVTEFRVAVRRLRDIEVSQLQQQFDLRCCMPAHEFHAELAEQVARHPELGRALPVVLNMRGGTAQAVEFMFEIVPLGGVRFGNHPFDNGVLVLERRR